MTSFRPTTRYKKHMPCLRAAPACVASQGSSWSSVFPLLPYRSRIGHRSVDRAQSRRAHAFVATRHRKSPAGISGKERGGDPRNRHRHVGESRPRDGEYPHLDGYSGVVPSPRIELTGIENVEAARARELYYGVGSPGELGDHAHRRTRIWLYRRRRGASTNNPYVNRWLDAVRSRTGMKNRSRRAPRERDVRSRFCAEAKRYACWWTSARAKAFRFRFLGVMHSPRPRPPRWR